MLKRLFVSSFLAMAFAMAAIVGVMSMQGCATLGVPSADTVNKKAAEGYISLAAAAHTVVTLRQAGKMDDATHVKTIVSLGAAREAIDDIVQQAPIDPAAADAKLRQALALIASIQAVLATQQAGGK